MVCQSRLYSRSARLEKVLLRPRNPRHCFFLELISFHQADGTNVFITKELDGSQIDGILVEVLEAKNLEKRRNVYVDAVLEGQTLSTGVCDDMPLPKWGGEGLVLNVRSDWSELICIVLSKVRDLVCMSACVRTCVRTCLRACVLLVLFVVLRVRSDCGELIRNVILSAFRCVHACVRTCLAVGCCSMCIGLK